MGKFTPGPWRWWSCHDGSFKPSGDYVQIASGKTQVAKVQIISVTDTDLVLMAAAPELLAALQELDDYVCNNLESNYPTGVDIDNDAFHKARAAIAKATGGTA